MHGCKVQANLDLTRLSKDTLLYGSAVAIGRSSTLFLAPILTHLFAPSEYGALALVQFMTGLFAVFAGLNISSGVGYFFFEKNERRHQGKVLFNGYLVAKLFSTVLCCVYFFSAKVIAQVLFGDQIDQNFETEIVHMIEISSISLFFSIMLISLQSKMRFLHKPSSFLAIEFIVFVVNLVLVISLLLILNHGIYAVIWTNAIANFAGFLIAFYVVCQAFTLSFSKVIAGDILLYALPQVPSVILNWLQVQAGRYFLSQYSGISELGIYSLAFTVGGLVLFLGSAFRLAYDPYALSVMNEKDAKEKYRDAFFVAGLLILLASVVLGLFARPIIFLISPAEYQQAHMLVPFIAIGSFYVCINNILATGIWLSKKTIYTSISSLISCSVVLLFCFMVIPIYGALAAAFSFVCGGLVQSFAYYYFSQKLYRINYNFWEIQFLTVVIILVFSCYVTFAENMLLWSNVVFSFVISVLMATTVFLALRNRLFSGNQ